MATLRTEFAFELRVQVGPAVELGAFDRGRRRVVPILGGTVAGPRLSGTVLPGGADWQTIRPDGTAEIAARYALKLADGTAVGVDNRGVRRGPPEVLAKLAAGERVDPAAYYFRTVPVFDVVDGPHGWLTRSAFVAAGERWSDSVLIRVWEVL